MHLYQTKTYISINLKTEIRKKFIEHFHWSTKKRFKGGLIQKVANSVGCGKLGVLN